jgi:hypothetical protein
VCVPGDLDCPVQSCRALRDSGATTEDGLYWIDPDTNGVGAFRAYCLLSGTYHSGGWTLAVVSSDDSNQTWTWDNRAYWTNNVVFGDVDILDHDFKSKALSELPMTDVLFIHQPSGIWAVYAGIDTGERSLGELIDMISPDGLANCYGPDLTTDDFEDPADEQFNGFPMTAGDLTLQERLCDTNLYFNAQDRDGRDCGEGNGDDTFGPGWNASNDTDNCPFDDPSKAALGPSKSRESLEMCPQRIAGEGLGFGFALRLNTGARGGAENYMQVFVR